MKQAIRRTAGPAAVAVIAAVNSAHADTPAVDPVWRVEVEAQAFRLDRNLVQRPNNADGTRFDANDYTGKRGTGWRFSAARPVDWWRRNGEFRFAVVPLKIQGTALAASPVRFDGATFAAGQPLDVLYQFNTYRFGYNEAVAADLSGPWSLRVGATLAIRDARIRLRQGATERDFPNVGPVPLLYVAASRPVFEGMRLIADFDAFPAPGGGGLFDGSVRLEWALTPAYGLTAGVRYQAGAAVDPTIYNSLRQTNAVVGLTSRF